MNAVSRPSALHEIFFGFFSPLLFHLCDSNLRPFGPELFGNCLHGYL